MKFTLESHKWIVDNKRYLGFVGVNISECEIGLLNFEIKDLINQGLLIDAHFASKVDSQALSTSIYGPIELDELESDDFIQCDNGKLAECYTKYWSDKNWGSDLEVFKKHKTDVDDYLKQQDFSSDNHFFLCQEWLSEKKHVELNFFAYFVCVISISKNRIAVTTYGED